MFYCGSYSFLKEKLKENIQEVQKNNIGKKLTFIVHTNQMKTYLKEYLTEKLGILINAEFYTLIDISKKITGIEPLQDFDKELILKKILYENGVKLPGLSEDFSSLIQQLKEFEIPFENLKSTFVKKIINDYQNFLEENSYYDREDLHKIALKKQGINFDFVFVFGIKSVPSLHQKLYKKIKSNCENFFVFSPVFFDSGVYENYNHLKDIRQFWENLTTFPENEKTKDENITLGKRIYKFEYDLEKLKNENIKIYKAKNEYEEIEYTAQAISNLLNKNEKPHTIGVVIPNIETYLPFIKEIFKKYKIPYYLIEETRYIDENIFKKLFNIFKIKENNFSKDYVLNILSDRLLNIENIDQLEEKIILQPISEGFEEWEIFLFKDDNENSLYKLLKVINSIPDKANIDEYINIFEQIKDNFIKDEKAKNFLENILNSLKNTNLYKKLFTKVEYQEFVSIVETFFYEENKEKRIKGNTISVLTPTSAEANNFDYIFFLNINSGDFPSTIKEEILANPHELNGLDYPYHLLMQQILNFVNILDKDKKIYISFLLSSVFSGDKAPSIIVEEIKRLLTIEEIPLIKTDEENTLKDFYIKNIKQIVDFNENLKEKWEKIQKIKNISNKNDFKFEEVNLKFPVSATKFTTYAYCPYKFYLDNLIGIEDLEETDRKQISPIEKGILVHELLEEFYKNYPYNKNLNKKLKQIEKKYREEIERLLLYVLPSYRPFEKEKAEKLLERLINFINFDLKRLKNDKKEPVILEKSYKNKYFTGKIDRIDKDENENFYIYDYKTGKPPENILKEIKDKYIQLLIYKDFLENETKNVKEIGVFAINDPKEEFLYDIDKEEELKELKNHLNNLLQQLKEKIFYPQENEYCHWCPYIDFCLKDKIKEE